MARSPRFACSTPLRARKKIAVDTTTVPKTDRWQRARPGTRPTADKIEVAGACLPGKLQILLCGTEYQLRGVLGRQTRLERVDQEGGGVAVIMCVAGAVLPHNVSLSRTVASMY